MGVGRSDDQPLHDVVASRSDRPSVELSEIASTIRDGDVVFVLGTYAHLGRVPLADEFYEQLAEQFGTRPLRGQRSAIARHIANRRGQDRLWKAARRSLDVQIEPSAVYRFIAAIPSFVRSRSQNHPTWIVTTNYDTVLERTLEDARQPFHVLYYMEPEGQFLHISPYRKARVIERPAAIRDLEPAATVVVKLNGGLLEWGAQPESVVMAAGQFDRLAAQMPDGLPACVRSTLEARAMLFLGHGLVEPDIGRLIELYAPTGRTPSWAVQLPPSDVDAAAAWREDVEYRDSLNLTTVSCDLEQFIGDLRDELLRDSTS